MCEHRNFLSFGPVGRGCLHVGIITPQKRLILKFLLLNVERLEKKKDWWLTQKYVKHCSSNQEV